MERVANRYYQDMSRFSIFSRHKCFLQQSRGNTLLSLSAPHQNLLPTPFSKYETSRVRPGTAMFLLYYKCCILYQVTSLIRPLDKKILNFINILHLARAIIEEWRIWTGLPLFWTLTFTIYWHQVMPFGVITHIKGVRRTAKGSSRECHRVNKSSEVRLMKPEFCFQLKRLKEGFCSLWVRNVSENGDKLPKFSGHMIKGNRYKGQNKGLGKLVNKKMGSMVTCKWMRFLSVSGIWADAYSLLPS